MATEAFSVDYYEEKNPNATVAVIDSFASPYSDKPVTHGNDVMQVLQRSGNVSSQDIQKINDGIRVSPFTYDLFREKGEEGAEKRITAGIELSAVESLRRTSRVLEEIANDPNSKIKTVNQSQATNRYHVFLDLTSDTLQLSPMGNSVSLTPKGEYLLESFGLPPVYTTENFQAFEKKAAEKIDKVIETSPLIQKELTRHANVSRKLSEKGINYVVAAGNQREAIRERVKAGIVSPNFDDSLYANPYNITVGAIDDKGTAARGDDTLADFSSVSPEVDFLASGVNVPVQDGHVSGTSFAAPLIAGRLAQLRELHPKATAKQLQDLLLQSSSSILDSAVPVVY